MLRSILTVIVVLFPISEIVLAVVKRANARGATVDDRGSMRLLWLVVGASVFVAAGFQWVPAASIKVPAALLEVLALALLLLGLVVRWSAILTLGRFFTVDVAVQSDHHLVETGLYRYIRHPSYSGLLLLFLGLGVYFANWLSLAALTVPVLLAVLKRISLEERVLRDGLGKSYSEYCTRTRKLVPGLF